MATQTELALEDKLIAQLVTLGYEEVDIQSETGLVRNLKKQLEKHNRTAFSDEEFKKILNQVSSGNIYDKAKKLRDKVAYTRDSGGTAYINLVDSIMWCKNEFQVARQVEMVGAYENRYDVTLLINGLPLVQIELKRRGGDIRDAFNQIDRYHKHSYWAGWKLFNYIQVFVISNGVDTKYFANNPPSKRGPGNKTDFKQTFFWTDRDNRRITRLPDFAEAFLEKCQLSKFITKYVVINEGERKLMAMRPYQYHAVETLVERVRTSIRFGYIWHTTGSGKTLTAFKAAQILTGTSGIDKVLFIVDRKDLDYKTIREFNSFRKDSVDRTGNTQALVRQLGDDTELIVTTLQKLNNAIRRHGRSKTMATLHDKRMVFIFDECHRSQFGVTHRNITTHFPKVQMFGFTGTPILVENAAVVDGSKRTTADLFDECLHKYVITDAINDENVLRFLVEYYKTFEEDETIRDSNVEDIDTDEVWQAEQRLDAVADYIINNHDRKTHKRHFNAIFCVANINTLCLYYEIFKRKQENGEHDLKIATIFSYQGDRDDNDADGQDTDRSRVNKLHRDRLEDYIQDYNKTYGAKFSTGKKFSSYYQDIGKRVSEREKNRIPRENIDDGIDILLVVNMFLTGFDSPYTNTVYVDKNLSYHGLIQAYSRTNRILGRKKAHGNVVCFRNLKAATDEAITLFSNKDAIDRVLLEPYEKYVEWFNQAVVELRQIAANPGSVDELKSETDQLNFVRAFRKLMGYMSVLECFQKFSFSDLDMEEQTYADYTSKYRYLYDKSRTDRQKEKVSILDDVDFGIELIHRDNINVDYILRLLVAMHNASPGERDRRQRAIIRTLDTDNRLHSKKELIKRFIEQYMADMPHDGDVGETFQDYWEREKQAALKSLCIAERMPEDGLNKIIVDYLYSGKEPLRTAVIDLLHERPRLAEYNSTYQRILEKIKSFVETYIDGID